MEETKLLRSQSLYPSELRAHKLVFKELGYYIVKINRVTLSPFVPTPALSHRHSSIHLFEPAAVKMVHPALRSKSKS